MPLSLGLGGGYMTGADAGSPVCNEYEPPFEFDAKINSLVIDVTGKLRVDNEARLRAILARQ
jgi:arylsulfatase